MPEAFVEYASDGRLFVVQNELIQIWDGVTGKELETAVPGGDIAFHKGSLAGLKRRPGGAIDLYGPQFRGSARHDPARHLGLPLGRLDYAPLAEMLAYVGPVGDRITLWEATTGRLWTIATGESGQAVDYPSVSLSPDARHIAMGPCEPLPTPQGVERFLPVCFRSWTERWHTSDRLQEVRVFDTSDGRELFRLPGDRGVFSDDGKVLIVVGDDVERMLNPGDPKLIFVYDVPLRGPFGPAFLFAIVSGAFALLICHFLFLRSQESVTPRACRLAGAMWLRSPCILHASGDNQTRSKAPPTDRHLPEGLPAMSRLSRRRFLHHAATGLSAAAFAGTLPASDGKAPPSERLRVGVIGVAGRGADNLKGVAHEEIVALCDVDENRAGKARQEHPRAKFYQDFRRLLDHKDIEAVVISTPDHMHAIPALLAMRAGKHVYCEKPLAHSVHEIRVMRETAAKHKIVTQMGTQIHAGDNYRRVVELVRGGVIGSVNRVQVWLHGRPYVRKLGPSPVPAGFDLDLWLGPVPKHPYDTAYIPFHWRWFWDFGGGTLADMACHYMDLPHWALDLMAPLHVEALQGRKCPGETRRRPDVLSRSTTAIPACGERPAVHLTWYSGRAPSRPPLNASEEPFEGYQSGVLFEGTRGKLLADYSKHKLLPESQFHDFKPPQPTIAPSLGHHREWLAAIRTGGPTTCNFAYSGTLAETVLLGNVSYRSGKAFAWNEHAGTADAPEAAAFLRRDYRKGWTL